MPHPIYNAMAYICISRYGNSPFPVVRFCRDTILALNVAKSLQDLSPLKSVGLHKLKANRREQ